MAKTKQVSAKKKCCKDDLRCKTCPVVLLRLSKMGYAERDDARRYVVDRKVPKKALLVARQR
ncbi:MULTISPECIES: hypothetical protein [unclassified Janibacter]|uniref:hypothetical protein n=1 Tax=unclassified Janibacter TaxID=2649294 RepID=UPI003D04BA4C